MKPLIALLVLCALLQAKELLTPPFVAEHEPFPKALSIGVQYGKSTNWHFDLFPTAWGNTRAMISPNIGAMGSFYENQFTCDAYTGIYGGAIVGALLGTRGFLQSYQSIGLFGDTLSNDTEQLKYFGIHLLGMKLRPNLLLSAGALVNSRYGDPLILPLVRVVYATPKFMVDGLLPANVKALWFLTPDWRAGAMAEFLTANFATATPAYLETSSMRAMALVHRRIAGWLWAEVAAGYCGETIFKSEENDEIDRFNGGPMIEVKLLLNPE